MKRAAVGLVWLLLLVVAVPAVATPQARVGSGFSDIYSAFAPLGVLHRSYGDYLFYGSNVAIPDGLPSACESCAYEAALLQTELYTQTGSYVAMTQPRLARFRADLAAFCNRYEPTLEGLSQTGASDLEVLHKASEEGLFSTIYDLQQELQSVFEICLDSLREPEEKWSFAAAFSLRTLLKQEAPETISSSLRDILFGSPEATSPPGFVPEVETAAINKLLTYINVPLDETGIEDVHDLAQSVYTYVMNDL